MSSLSITKDRIIICSIFAVLIFYYYFFRSSHVDFADGIDFLIGINQGFIWETDATTHFLYINTLYVFNKIIPWGTDLSHAVLFSLIFSVLTNVQLFRLVRFVTNNIWAGLAVTLLFGLSFTNWRQTEIVEVYTFNNFVFATFLYYTIVDLITHQNKNNYLVSILLGLAMLIHIQNVLLIPGWIMYLIITNGFKLKQNLIAMSLPGCFRYSRVDSLVYYPLGSMGKHFICQNL